MRENVHVSEERDYCTYRQVGTNQYISVSQHKLDMKKKKKRKITVRKGGKKREREKVYAKKYVVV